jgi:hypothetical protein
VAKVRPLNDTGASTRREGALSPSPRTRPAGADLGASALPTPDWASSALYEAPVSTSSGAARPSTAAAAT